MTCDECKYKDEEIDALLKDYKNLKENSLNSVREVKNTYDELVEKYKKNIDDYNELRRKYNSLVEEGNSLIRNHNNSIDNNRDKYNNLVGEYNDLLGRNKENTEKYNKLVNEYNELLKSSSKKYINLQSDYNVLLDEKKRLEEKYDNLDCECKSLKQQLVETTDRLEGLRIWFSNLKMISSEKDHELEKRERKIKELKELLGKSREEIIDYKIKNKEEKLENIIKKVEIDRAKIRELRKVCQQLVRIQEVGNQDEIDDNNDKIEDIKDELIDKGLGVVDAEKICRRCKSVAKLKEEQERLYQERFEAKQEVVLYDKKPSKT